MQSLSLVIITLNEERNIARCLDSVKDVADDIVVLDSFSIDRTEELCKKYPVRFFQKKWMGYAAQKNEANSLAKYDWILSLDADEALSPELKSAILLAKQGTDRVYKFKRLTNYCGQWIKHSGWYPDIKIRLFDRRHARWTGDYVHETLLVDEPANASLLAGDCLHYSYYSVEQHKKQVEKFAALAAKEMFDRGKTIFSMEIWIRTAFKFFSNYFLKLGFLDGYYGLVICRISAWGVYKKLSLLNGMKRKQGN